MNINYEMIEEALKPDTQLLSTKQLGQQKEIFCSFSVISLRECIIV